MVVKEGPARNRELGAAARHTTRLIVELITGVAYLQRSAEADMWEKVLCDLLELRILQENEEVATAVICGRIWVFC